jgi:DNA-binding cell septation regulator SpoVG
MEIGRMTKGDWGKIKAYFDVELQGITIKGFKLIEGDQGLFVGGPSIRKEDGTYDNICIITEPQKGLLQMSAIKHYEQN